MPDVRDTAMFTELCELLRIPSVSAGEPNPEGIEQAAEWIARKIRDAGGTCEVLATDSNPLVVGELRASTRDAPTVLLYGHYDVQSPGPRELWDTEPFQPTIKDDRVYCRGACDDKGNSWPTLYVACEMAKAGELPINLRICFEGDEEQGSAPVMRWLASDERGADCAVVFDTGSLDPDQPAITVGTRGIIQALVRVRVAERDLHSGVFGGSVHNAIHVLHGMLAPVLPGPDGILREELRRGVEPIPESERRSWEGLPSGDTLFELAGARPLTPSSGRRYFEQNAGEPSVDVTMFRSGEARTIVPATAEANVTMRLAPGQSYAEMTVTLERLMRDAAPAGVDCDLAFMKGVGAASFDSASPPLRIAREAFEAACGTAPVMFRLGGSIPILAPLTERGIQAIVSGFATPLDQIHAPNESYLLAGLERGAAVSRELYRRLADLPRGG